MRHIPKVNLVHSAIADDDREFFVYTPAGYDVKRPQPYPVLNLLHGLGGDAGRWMNAGGANFILDNLTADGKARPMVVVTTLGYGTSGGPSQAMTPNNLRGYERILLTEVMPIVEKAYHVGRTPAQRAIAGLSMGGATSTFVGLNHLDQFGWVGSFSGAFATWPEGTTAPEVTTATSNVLPTEIMDRTFPALIPRAASKLRLLWIACGTSDGLISLNRQFKTWLTAKGIKFTQAETDGAHSWDVWRRNLTEFAPLLFR